MLQSRWNCLIFYSLKQGVSFPVGDHFSSNIFNFFHQEHFSFKYSISPNGHTFSLHRLQNPRNKIHNFSIDTPSYMKQLQAKTFLITFFLFFFNISFWFWVYTFIITVHHCFELNAEHPNWMLSYVDRVTLIYADASSNVSASITAS